MTLGIDYGLGKTNINQQTGIRYGVISQHSVMIEAWADAEPQYGEPTCPKCGTVLVDSADQTVSDQEWDNYREHGCADYACKSCELFFDSSDSFPEEPYGYKYESDGYTLTDCLDSDIFVLNSPYYTFAQFCSPCVPGAGNLDNAMPDGVKTYCLGHDWFDGGCAPYPVYRVEDGTEVLAEVQS